jgi:crotonobetainyl-CoA:carnitine CoA-transferase CaiB-like acyl-CoA transferase
MTLLSSLEILQIRSPDVAAPCLRAVDFIGQLAVKSGAKVQVTSDFPLHPAQFSGRGKSVWDNAKSESPTQWTKSSSNRILLLAGSPGYFDDLLRDSDVAAVEINMESWHSESTLFAQSGLADLLGDPQRAPLVPTGYYAAASVGYAGFTALIGVYTKLRRLNEPEVARVNGVAAMGWINWKAAAAGYLGNDLHREGPQAEWPVLPCSDGYVAFVFTERDWDAIVRMVSDETLHNAKFETFTSRQKHRDEYMKVIRNWVASKKKAELADLFYQYAIPAAPVATPADLLQDQLLLHREAFTTEVNDKGVAVVTPVAPHRVIADIKATTETNTGSNIIPPHSAARLPLEGIKVLDLGIITAGAGTTGLLADMGAEVLKVESNTYFDPFRMWAGSTDSPLFKFNNRNKYGVDIDLKSEVGKQRFLKLVETADVVVENFRRGVLERMGLNLEVLREANPNILLVSVSGQGLDGPGSDNTTFGSTLEASSGFAAQTCYEDGLPYITGRNVNYPDQTVCLYAAAMISAALVHCQEANSAMQLDISQRDVAMYILGDVLEDISAGGNGEMESTSCVSAAPELDDMYRCADGRWVALTARHNSNLCHLPELKNAVSLKDWTAQRTAEEVVAAFQGNGRAATKVLFGSEMYTHPVIRENGVFAKSPGGTLVKGFPFQFQNSTMSIWGDAPKVGEHTDKYL